MIKRLTRPEQQAKTRAELLSAARDGFLREGYARCSLEAIAETAGFSKGAVYSNFVNKEALFLELLEDKLAADAHDVGALLAPAQTPATLLKALENHLASHGGILDFTGVAVEFMSQAGKGSSAARHCARLYRNQRAVVSQLIRELFAAAGLAPVQAVEISAASCIALTLGLATQRRLDPDAFDAGVWATAVADYLAGLLAAARQADESA